MSELDLDAIRRRRQSLAVATSALGPRATRLIHEDVPALLAEIERLKAVIAEAGELFALAEVADVEPDWYLAISAWRNRVRSGR
jgi:hypothetical protein